MVGTDSPIVGVVGGAGPEASNKFCEILIQNKTTQYDQDNVRFIHFCNPRIPDRTEFILGRGEDPVPEIVTSCERLEKAGADFLIIPCNTAHAFLERIREKISLPLVDMVGLTARAIKNAAPKIARVGILATSGSIRSGLFSRYLAGEGIEAMVPSEADQDDLVMMAIYGDDGIKAGGKLIPAQLLTESATKLVAAGAEAIILGCTEISLVLSQTGFEVRLYDPMQIAADEIIKNLQCDPIGNLLYEASHSIDQPIKEMIATYA